MNGRLVEMTEKRIVVFTGSGISAESGIRTFRDSGGLWEEHRVEDVATPQAFMTNPSLVLDFYNKRRRQVIDAKPNAAHLALVDLEEQFDVQIITQNVDDLHERAGSSSVLHLHGEIIKGRSSRDYGSVVDLEGRDINLGDTAADGSQLRPHIVWFGESVPMLEPAIQLCNTADLMIIIGTSLEVYPAASLLHYTPADCKKIFIDPEANSISVDSSIRRVAEKAGTGVPKVVSELLGNV